MKFPSIYRDMDYILLESLLKIDLPFHSKIESIAPNELLSE